MMNNNPYGEIYDIFKTKESQQSFYIGDVVEIGPLKMMVNEMVLYENNLYMPKHIDKMSCGDTVILVKYNDQKYILLGVVR